MLNTELAEFNLGCEQIYYVCQAKGQHFQTSLQNGEKCGHQLIDYAVFYTSCKTKIHDDWKPKLL